jgi:hypothetical protein
MLAPQGELREAVRGFTSEAVGFNPLRPGGHLPLRGRIAAFAPLRAFR